MLKKVLTIAGSDCSGGAGIQADIKTITVHKMYAMSAITSLTAQNTTGVFGISDVSPEFVGMQLECIFSDIRPDAIKIGMVSNSEIIKIITEKLIKYEAKNIVLDPVMVSTTGKRLLSNDAMEEFVSRLFRVATIITPNIPEAEILCGIDINSENDMIKAASKLSFLVNGAVLIKGGHLKVAANDLLYDNGIVHWFRTPQIKNPNTHGTGCTLSSAIACNLANNIPLDQCIRIAKDFITGSIMSGLNIGNGNGPLDHTYKI